MKKPAYLITILYSVFIMSLARSFLIPTEVPTNVPAINIQVSSAEPMDSASNSGFCNNKYLPIVNDTTKIYTTRTTIEGSTSSSTNYETILYFGDRNYFTVSTRLGSRVGYPVDDIWDCSNNGLTKSAFESGEFSNFFISVDTGFSTRQTGDWCPGGITLPVDIHANDSWTQQTDFQFTSSNLRGWNWFKWNILHQPLKVQALPFPAGSGRFIYEYHTAGIENINVPAGTFEAIRIDVIAEGHIDPSRDFSPTFENSRCAWNANTIDQVNPLMTLTFEGSTWWVSDIGWVKKEGILRNSQEVIKSYEIELESLK